MRFQNKTVIAFVMAVFLCGAIATISKSQVELETASNQWKLRNGFFELTVTDSGLVTAAAKDGEVRILNGYGRIKFESAGKTYSIDTAGSGPWTLDSTGNPQTPEADNGRLAINTPVLEGGIVLTWIFTAADSKPGFTAQLSVRNQGNGDIDVKEIVPLRTDKTQNSGAFVGADPARSWILENGYKMTMDFWERLIPGNQQSLSDWNSAAYDPGSGQVLLGGFLTDDIASVVQVRSVYNPGQGIKDGDRTAFTAWSGYCGYEPHKVLAPGQGLNGEIFYVDFTSSDPLEALETFADAAAKANKINIWSGPVPTGWNSWATAYDHDLSQDSMLKEARDAAAKLLDFGLTTFQIDDPWQKAVGDWTPNEFFPDGMPWMMQELQNLGFRVRGLWLAPFVMSVNSDLYKNHPDWAAPPNTIGRTVLSSDWRILDLSHPQVKEYLRQVFTRLKKEYKVNWVKLDFIYFALVSDNYYDKTKTNVEIFRDMLRLIRECMGTDTFITLVAVPIETGLGYADGMRLGLDLKPVWNDSDDYNAYGVKPMYKSMSRRYYLNHRVWINHPDMWYLGVEDEEDERWGSHLTFEEAHLYATAVGLSGGITKIGNSFTRLDEKRLDLLLKLLPPITASARPMDLFEMRYPEVWNLPVSAKGLQYNAVGLFNWGLNFRWGTEIPESERAIGADLKQLGLDPGAKYYAFGFWNQQYLGEFSNRLELKLPARSVEVVFLTPSTGKPALIGTNRHVAGAMTQVKEIKSQNDGRLLTLSADVDPGFDYKFTFFAPEGFKFIEARTHTGDGEWKTGAEQKPAPGGQLLTVGFLAPERASVEIVVAFEKAK